jgi:hypothetical protein
MLESPLGGAWRDGRTPEPVAAPSGRTRSGRRGTGSRLRFAAGPRGLDLAAADDGLRLTPAGPSATRPCATFHENRRLGNAMFTCQLDVVSMTHVAGGA